MNAAFRSAIAHYPTSVRQKLAELHSLVLLTAKSLPGVGQLTEDLRWGQPIYLTLETGSGSAIRMDGLRADTTRVALYFHCQSGWVSQFRDLYGDLFEYEKDRAILLPVDQPLAQAELAHCISLALTHHMRKKSASRKRK